MGKNAVSIHTHARKPLLKQRRIPPMGRRDLPIQQPRSGGQECSRTQRRDCRAMSTRGPDDIHCLNKAIVGRIAERIVNMRKPGNNNEVGRCGTIERRGTNINIAR